jgi:predicted Mrr-cat superfamily restriction endonuclease
MRRAWVVRAGKNAKEIDAMRDAGLIGVDFETVGDVRTMTQQEIEHAIAASGRTGVENLRSRLMRFVNDVHIGDLVITPNGTEHDLWVSMVTGPYEYLAEPPVPGYHHVHTVDWMGWLDRSDSWLQHKLKYLDVSGAVIELRDTEWWLDQVGARDLPTDRPPRRFTPAPKAAPRARKPAAAPAPVKPKEPARALCAGQCGFQWAVAVLVDGLCADCRGD